MLFVLVQGLAPGSFVTQCNATDADAGANAQITYHILEGAANKFDINNTTGVITTTAQLDRETGVTNYMVSDYTCQLCQTDKHTDTEFIV